MKNLQKQRILNLLQILCPLAVKNRKPDPPSLFMHGMGNPIEIQMGWTENVLLPGPSILQTDLLVRQWSYLQATVRPAMKRSLCPMFSADTAVSDFEPLQPQKNNEIELSKLEHRQS